MSFLYRFALTITRKRPYLEWANRGPDAPALTEDLARAQRNVYLVPETPFEPDLEPVLGEFWERIFALELGEWNDDEAQWPSPLTREMFDAWFDVEITGSVCDLTPDEPLTQDDIDLADVESALHTCAWCEIDIEDHAGRFVAFKMDDRAPLAHRAGFAVPLRIDEERFVVGIMSPDGSDAAQAGEDIAFRACSSRCEKALRKVVPRALRKAAAVIETVSE